MFSELRKTSVLAGLVVGLSSVTLSAPAEAAIMVEANGCFGGSWVQTYSGDWICLYTYSGGGDGGGGGGSSYEPPDGGGGSGTTTVSGRQITAINPTNNPDYATKQSTVDDRHAHAAFDVARTQSARLATFQSPLKTGDVMKVTYNDGSTEKWMVTDPYFSDPISPVPEAGSLSGP